MKQCLPLYTLAYTAGLMDGEGSVCLSRRGSSKYRSPDVTIPSTTYVLMTFLKKHFGGCVSSKRKNKQHHSQSWIWSVTNDSALRFLDQVAPFLMEPEKKRRAFLLLHEYKSVTPRNGKYTPEALRLKARFERDFFKNARRRLANTQ